MILLTATIKLLAATVILSSATLPPHIPHVLRSIPPSGVRGITSTLPPATLVLQPATLVLQPATLILPPATLILPPAMLILPPATLVLQPATLILPPATLILPPATLILQPTIKKIKYLTKNNLNLMIKAIANQIGCSKPDSPKPFALGIAAESPQALLGAEDLQRKARPFFGERPKNKSKQLAKSQLPKALTNRTNS